MSAPVNAPTLDDPFWTHTVKDQCDQAKHFWELWVGRQCSKCGRYHLTEDEVEILTDYEENFSKSRALFARVQKLLYIDIKNRTDYFKICRIDARKAELREAARFCMGHKKEYREATGERRVLLWEYECGTEQLLVELEDIGKISTLIDKLQADLAKGGVPDGECAQGAVPKETRAVLN